MTRFWIPAFAGMTILFLSVLPLRAERRGDQGIGVMIGNPSGLSWKMWLDENIGVDAAVGIDRSEFDVHASLLWHNFTWSKNSSEKLLQDITESGDFPVYIGIGPRVLFEDESEFGVRFPLGLSFIPHNTNWDTFLEVAPVLRLTPDTGWNADFSIGARYYFKAIRPMTQ